MGFVYLPVCLFVCLFLSLSLSLSSILSSVFFLSLLLSSLFLFSSPAPSSLPLCNKCHPFIDLLSHVGPVYIPVQVHSQVTASCVPLFAHAIPSHGLAGVPAIIQKMLPKQHARKRLLYRAEIKATIQYYAIRFFVVLIFWSHIQ